MKEKLELPKCDLGCHQDRVVVYADDPEERTASGLIIIPDSVKGKPSKGRVVNVGPGDENHEIPEWLVRGAHVAYGKYAGSEYEFQGNEFLIMRSGDIIGPVVDPY